MSLQIYLRISLRSLASENKSARAFVASRHGHRINGFGIIPACDIQADGRTDRHKDRHNVIASTALAWRRAVKTGNLDAVISSATQQKVAAWEFQRPYF